MPLNPQRIKDIAAQEFAQASDADIQTWLRGAIVSWSTEGSVLSFSPFQNFFPSTQDEIASLSLILQALPTEKISGKPYSMQDQFRRALTNLLATKEVYLGEPDIWEFSFDLAKEIDLSECINAIRAIVTDIRFREKANGAGTPLFDAALRLSFTFGPTDDVVAFWKSCLPFIGEASHLSTQLYLRLVEAAPQEWADFASDTKMRTALIRYHHSQTEINPEACEKRFDRLRLQASSIVTDSDYLAGVQKLKYRDLAFLIDVKRVRSLVTAAQEYQRREGEGALGRTRRRKAQPNSLRQRAGQKNKIAFQERYENHRQKELA